MNQVYRAMGTTKQNVHQRLNRNLASLDEGEQLFRIIHQVRGDHPEMGARPLYRKIRPKTMGRDRFYKWYASAGLT